MYDLISKRFLELDIEIIAIFMKSSDKIIYLLCVTKDNDYFMIETTANIMAEENIISINESELKDFPSYMTEFITYESGKIPYTLLSQNGFYISNSDKYFSHNADITLPINIMLYIQVDKNNFMFERTYNSFLKDLKKQNRKLQLLLYDFHKDSIYSMKDLPNLMSTLSKFIIEHVENLKNYNLILNKLPDIDSIVTKMEDVVIDIKKLEKDAFE